MRTHCLVSDGGASAALCANDSDLFKRWLSSGVQDLGEPVVKELLLDWLDPFLKVEEQHTYGLATEVDLLGLPGKANARALKAYWLVIV